MSKDDDRLTPKDHAEAVAIFRMQVLGGILSRDLMRGELAPALRTLSEERFMPPGSLHSKTFAVPTLQTWYYRAKKHGLEGLKPKPRSDRGYAQVLTDQQRDLLLEIRKEHPTASVPLILRTLEADGRIDDGAISEATVRRFYADHGLDRASIKASNGERRMRWAAERPGQLYHADVCHGAALKIRGRSVPLRIHAILDDASRYVPAIKASSTEREVEMLDLVLRAVRRHGGAPRALYLDNGPTYSGVALQTMCARLGVTLIHAKPYDPQSRGKMERFWRTLREGCLDHLGHLESLHDVEVRLYAFLDQHYHRAPHGGLVGKSPAEVFETQTKDLVDVSEDDLRDALTVRGRRRIRSDGTVPIGGIDWEVDKGFLAGRRVQVARTLYDPTVAPWVEKDGKRYPLHPVEPTANAKKRRRPPKKAKRGVDAIPFDPTKVLLDRALCRKMAKEDNR